MVENYAYINDAFTKDECQKIIDLANKKEKEIAKINSSNSKIENENLSIRKSQILWLDYNDKDFRDFYEKVGLMSKYINDQFFHFNLSGFFEPLQFTEYNAPDGKYDWHIDKAFMSTTRKLSLVVQLTDPNEYEGGNLELLYQEEPVKMDRAQGSISFFPSYVTHRVTPITKGTRYSLVGWIAGENFK